MDSLTCIDNPYKTLPYNQGYGFGWKNELSNNQILILTKTQMYSILHAKIYIMRCGEGRYAEFEYGLAERKGADRVFSLYFRLSETGISPPGELCPLSPDAAGEGMEISVIGLRREVKKKIKKLEKSC